MPPHAASLRLALAGLALAAAGCSAPDEPEAGAVVRASSHAHLRVTLELAPDRAPRVLGSARFLRYADIDPATADVLTGAGYPALAPGRCELSRSEERLDEALSALPERALLEHLDAGELSIAAGGALAESIGPCRVPPLHPYVTGVEYDELVSVGEPELGSDPGEVTVSGFGGQHVGPFEVAAALPAAPEGVWAALDADLHVYWLSDDAGAGELVTVTVRRGASEVVLRCGAADDGRLVIARRVLDQMGLAPGAAGAEGLIVSVERTRRVAFAAPGMEIGELELAARSVVTASAR
jgi:hypothetical protein